MTDLVERLRDYSLFERGDDMDIWRNCCEAADEIEQLERRWYEDCTLAAGVAAQQRDEIERLRAEILLLETKLHDALHGRDHD